ncbi:MAG: hypothetical protein A3H97_18525 [Acidobacteria bacterium RIFCSPLOWO2_02_FULL_65_29]|nr:MAG: hypothetical protein A3H97_18525 [Acidobacteria bacterium RIFCSPLOWO2_02_FULL_65_29]
MTDRARALGLFAFVLALILPGPARAQGRAGDAVPSAVVAGTVELVEGYVRFFDRSLRARAPGLGEPILEGEAVVTGADGEVHLRMQDGGLIAVRPGTYLRIAGFRAEGEESDRLAIRLLEGSFRSVTGWIGKFARGNYRVQTPNAVIGVRGTDHEPFYIPETSTLGEPGTYDKVNAGSTYVETEVGRVGVDPGRAAFAALRPAEPPRLLDRIPAHFRPTKNEARIARGYEGMQEQLDRMREDRRNEMRGQGRTPDSMRDGQRRGGGGARRGGH